MKAAFISAIAAAVLMAAYDLSGVPVFAVASMCLAIWAFVWGVRAGIFDNGGEE